MQYFLTALSIKEYVYRGDSFFRVTEAMLLAVPTIRTCLGYYLSIGQFAKPNKPSLIERNFDRIAVCQRSREYFFR